MARVEFESIMCAIVQIESNRRMFMTHPRKLSECTDMTEEKFQECLERVDMKLFIENPAQALTDAGVTLKKGITFKFVETLEAANALPDNVFLLRQPPKNSEALSMTALDKVAGGREDPIGRPDLSKMTKAQVDQYWKDYYDNATF